MNNLTSNLNVLAKLAKVKSELQAVTKSANNPFFKSKYADLNTYLNEVEPRLEKEGLLLLQPCQALYNNEGHTVVKSIIFDVKTGESVESSMVLVGTLDMQKAGSAVTYGRRYTLGSLLAMQAEDDDGNAASAKTTAPKAKSVEATKTVTKALDDLRAASSGSAPEGLKGGPSTTRSSFRKPAASKATSSGDDL